MGWRARRIERQEQVAASEQVGERAAQARAARANAATQMEHSINDALDEVLATRRASQNERDNRTVDAAYNANVSIPDLAHASSATLRNFKRAQQVRLDGIGRAAVMAAGTSATQNELVDAVKRAKVAAAEAVNTAEASMQSQHAQARPAGLRISQGNVGPLTGREDGDFAVSIHALRLKATALVAGIQRDISGDAERLHTQETVEVLNGRGSLSEFEQQLTEIGREQQRALQDAYGSIKKSARELLETAIAQDAANIAAMPSRQTQVEASVTSGLLRIRDELDGALETIELDLQREIASALGLDVATVMTSLAKESSPFEPTTSIPEAQRDVFAFFEAQLQGQSPEPPMQFG